MLCDMLAIQSSKGIEDIISFQFRGVQNVTNPRNSHLLIDPTLNYLLRLG